MNSSTVRILRGAEQIGGYEINFPSFSEVTFEPFELCGSWFALYSRDYTSTRVMRLPSAKTSAEKSLRRRGFAPSNCLFRAFAMSPQLMCLAVA